MSRVKKIIPLKDERPMLEETRIKKKIVETVHPETISELRKHLSGTAVKSLVDITTKKSGSAKSKKDIDEEEDYAEDTGDEIDDNLGDDFSGDSEQDISDQETDDESDDSDAVFEKEDIEMMRNMVQKVKTTSIALARAKPKTIDDIFEGLDDKKISVYFSDNKLFPTHEHFIKFIAAINQHITINTKSVPNYGSRYNQFDFTDTNADIKKKISRCVDALVTSGYDMTPENHIMLFEYFDTVTKNLKDTLSQLMRKQLLSDEESKTLSRLAYLMIIDNDKKYEFEFYNKLTSQVSLIKTIRAFRLDMTAKQIVKIVPAESFTQDMLNVVMACVGTSGSPKKLKDYIVLFKDKFIYPDFRSFRALRKRSYKKSASLSHTEFISNRHKQINEFIFETYSK